jgi:hypothetical protein
VNSRQLALLTRQLIALAGGLDESARACRLKKSRLAECQHPASGAFLPIDVVNALEIYVGEPVVSRALVEDRPARLYPEDLVAEACRTAEDGSDLQRLVREALKPGRPVTPRQADAIEAELVALLEQVRRCRAALLDAEAAR